MIDIEMEISSLFLALRLAKQVELSRKRGDDDFTLFKNFATVLREYDISKGKSNK